MKVYCVFSLESPHWGDSNEYTQYTVFNIKKKITLNYMYPKAAAKGFFLGTQKRVRNSRGKRATSVRATEVLLYVRTDEPIYMLYGMCKQWISSWNVHPRRQFILSLQVTKWVRVDTSKLLAWKNVNVRNLEQCFTCNMYVVSVNYYTFTFSATCFFVKNWTFVTSY